MSSLNVQNADKNLIVQNGIYYFRKSIPKAYQGILGKKFWSKSLSTRDIKTARTRLKVCRGEYDISLSLCISKTSWLNQRFLQSVEYELSDQTDDIASIEVLKRLIQGQYLNQARSISDLIDKNNHHKTHHSSKPKYPTVNEMLDEYEKLTAERLVGLSWREVQKKLQPKRAAIHTLIDQIGDVNMSEISRTQALKFRSHMVAKVSKSEITAHTANKKMGQVRHIFNKVNDFHQHDLRNPFSGLAMEETTRRTPSFDVDWIQQHFINSNYLDGLSKAGRDCIHAMIETGANPKELILLDPEQYIILDHKYPHIWIRPNIYRNGLKTDHRERRIPLVGVALEVFKSSPDPFKGYRRPLGAEAMSAMCMKYCRLNGLFPSKQHRLYSFRHTFKNRMREAGFQQELQDYLMGHKNQGIGSQYGNGYSLNSMYSKLLKNLIS